MSIGLSVETTTVVARNIGRVERSTAVTYDLAEGSLRHPLRNSTMLSEAVHLRST